MKLENIRTKIKTIQEELNKEFVERDEEIHGLTLSILSNANVFLLGPPGVSKSLLVTKWQRHIKEARIFSYLLSQFTVPEELAGPVSLKKLQDDRYIRNGKGMLTEAHLGFLDEFWKGNSGVINFLLPMLNERITYSEGREQKIPLLALIGASNEIPTDHDLEAAFDRFTLKYDVKNISDQQSYITMMDNFINLDTSKTVTQITLEEINKARETVFAIPFDKPILIAIYRIVKELSKEGIEVSARLVNQSLRVIQAEAFLNGHEKVTFPDLGVLKNIYWKHVKDKPTISKIISREVNANDNKIDELLEKARNITDQIDPQYKDLSKMFSHDPANPFSINPGTYGENKLLSAFQDFRTIARDLNHIVQAHKSTGTPNTKAEKAFKEVNKYASDLQESAAKNRGKIPTF